MSSLHPISAGGDGPPTTLEFEVLYFQRKSKVHKSKGVSKFDGILTMNPGTGAIRLKDAGGDTESSSDEEEEVVLRGKKKQQQKYQQRKKQRKPVPYNGTDKGLTQRCCKDEPLQVDDSIVLGSYEVQIVSCLNKAPTRATKPTASLVALRKRPLGGGLKTGLSNAASAAKRQFLAKPLHSVKSKSSTTPSNKSTIQPLKKKKPLQSNISPPQIQRTSLVSRKGPLKSRSTTGKSLHPRKRQPAQPQQQKPATAVATTAVCPGIPLPGSVRNALRPHQVEGVQFLWEALAVGPYKGAILADEMGLGKTLMTIAVIMGLHRKHRDKHFIVVCPSSLVKNWAKEFDKWVGKASQPKRVIIQKGDSDSISRLKSVYSSTKSMGGQVLILSYELFRRVTENFTQSIGLVVMDEAHRIKNNGALTTTALESLACEARLAITATPVQNNLKEFYNLANFVRPGCLGEVSAFRRNFEKMIALGNQKNASREVKARGKEKSKELDALIKPFMLRRLQKDVLKSLLPPRTEVLLFCRPTPTQSQMYEKICQKATNASEAKEALTTLINLRQLCCHPSLLDEGKVKGNSVALSGKMTVLQSLLENIRKEGSKVVVVSNFTSVLTAIEATILRPKELPFVRLDGSTDQSERQGMVDNFNRPNSSLFAFLLSSKAGGCGLNLIGANRLIMFDADWNPATDTQAAARIYRPGQTKPCHIYRMFTTGTVEEVILQRQISKGSLAVFDGTKTSEKFTKEELADCFALKGCPCDTKEKLGRTWMDYDGARSLRDHGSTDEALLKVAGDHPDVLSFVHFVEEKENEKPEPKTATKIKPVESGGEEDSEASSSDEEMEF